MATKQLPRPYRFTCQLPSLIASTSHLSPEAFGALMRLRMAYWNNGPISDEPRVLARIIGAQLSDWSKIRGDLEQFFEIENGSWTCWTTQSDLEESYKAISANRNRTEKARLAKLDKKLQRGSDILCDRDSRSNSNNLCSNVLIGSIQSHPAEDPENPSSQPLLAKIKNGFSDDDLESLVSGIEAKFSEVDHVV